MKGKGEKEKIYPFEQQREQGEIKNSSSVINAKVIEENNRMGKTRDLFKKIRDTKGAFYEKMDTIKDRNDIDLIEEEEIKKRWQEYSEELYKKDLNDPNNHSSVLTNLGPDILVFKVKLALENITMNKATVGDGISVEMFQTLS